MLIINSLDITARLTHGTKKIVNELSFSVQAGEMLGIVGQSGCGKTMTALSIFGLLPKNCEATGRAIVNGVDMLSLPERKLAKLRGQKIAYMPQSGADFLNPSLKVKTHMYETLRRLDIPRNMRREKAIALLSSTGFAEPEAVMDKYPFQLSGGMAQRVVLALGLAGEPHLVIADEPTRGIDRDSAIEFIALLKKSFSDSALIVITHDISIANLCDNLLVMRGGAAVEYGATYDVITNPSHEYTRELIDAIP